MLSKIKVLSEIIDINDSSIIFKDSRMVIYEVFRGDDKGVSLSIIVQNMPLMLDLIITKSRYTDEEINLYIKGKMQNIQIKDALYANLRELDFERKILKDSFLLRTYFAFQVVKTEDMGLIDRLFKESGINMKRLSREEVLILVDKIWG